MPHMLAQSYYKHFVLFCRDRGSQEAEEIRDSVCESYKNTWICVEVVSRTGGVAFVHSCAAAWRMCEDACRACVE
jgi:hypothetical protein